MRMFLLGAFVLLIPWLSSAQAPNQTELLVDNLKEPFGVTFLNGEAIFVEYGGHKVRKIDSKGVVVDLAGNGKKGYTDGKNSEASFNQPHNLAVGPDGKIYIADTSNHAVRVVDTKSGLTSTLAGNGTKGFAGDGGPAKEARFDQAYHVAVDPKGENLYVCDLGNRRIRVIDLAKGTIRTVAGNGEKGVPKDGELAEKSPLVDPRAVEVDSAGRIWILERGGHALRVVENGKIRTVAGTGKAGFSGDGGPAKEATFNGPKFISFDPKGDVLICDTENHCVRKYFVQTGKIERVAGTGKKGKGDTKGNPLEVGLNRPHGATIGPDGALYIADSDNSRILRVK